MESFPEQLKRQERFYKMFTRQSESFAKAAMNYAKQTMVLGQLLEEFAVSQYQFDRPVINSMSQVLVEYANQLNATFPNLQAIISNFNCLDELRTMFALQKQQHLAKPPFHMQANIAFIENVAQFQQNRQRALKNISQNMSQFYVRQATALLQTATDVRRAGALLDETAPIVDVARRCANLETGIDVCQLLKISKRDFDSKNLNVPEFQPKKVVEQLPSRLSSNQAQFTDSLKQYNLKQYIKEEKPVTNTKFDQIPQLVTNRQKEVVYTVSDQISQQTLNQQIDILNQKERELQLQKEQLLQQNQNEIFIVQPAAQPSQYGNQTIQPQIQQQHSYQTQPPQNVLNQQPQMTPEQQAMLQQLLMLQHQQSQPIVQQHVQQTMQVPVQQQPIQQQNLPPIQPQQPQTQMQDTQPQVQLQQPQIQQQQPQIQQQQQPAQQQQNPAFKPLLDSTTLEISYNIDNQPQDSLQKSAHIEPPKPVVQQPQQRAPSATTAPKAPSAQKQPSKPPSRAASKTKNAFGNIYGEDDEDGNKKRSKSKSKYDLDIDIGIEDVKPQADKIKFNKDDVADFF